MKLVQCIIRQEKIMEVVEKLSPLVPGLTVIEVHGHGRQLGHSATYRGVEYVVSLRTKIMIEIVIDDTLVEDIVNAVSQTARTGRIGDGRIFVLPVEESYHVRTGFMDR
jgi:nitrogen regulatory protein PII